MTRRLVALLASGVTLFVLAAAFAQNIRQRRVQLARSSSALLISVGFQDLFDARARQKLDSGLWNRVVVRVNTRRVGQERPIALALRTCRVRYELWEEVFEVRNRFIIASLKERQRPDRNAFEAEKDKLKADLLRAKQRKAMEAWRDGMRARAVIKSSIRVEPEPPFMPQAMPMGGMGNI